MQKIITAPISQTLSGLLSIEEILVDAGVRMLPNHKLCVCKAHVAEYLAHQKEVGPEKAQLESYICNNLMTYWFYFIEAQRLNFIHQWLGERAMVEHKDCILEGPVPFTDRDSGNTGKTDKSFQLHMAA